MEETITAAAPVVLPTFTLDPSHPMASKIDSIATPPKVGDLVEGTIIELVRGRLYVDLPPFGTGIIYGREYLNAADVLRKTNPGDSITAKVVDAAGLEGYIELSLKEARQAAIWGEAEQAIAAQTVYNLTVEEANKGGLILSWQGIQGFLPASQLAKEHYPRVPEGDKDKIFGELQKLVGVALPVRIITADPKEGKLIFSERNGEEETEKGSLIDKYQVGDTIEGEVTGAVDFGVFVSSSRVSRVSYISRSSIGVSLRILVRSSR
jgi:small subunit ribosomal protein S1